MEKTLVVTPCCHDDLNMFLRGQMGSTMPDFPLILTHAAKKENLLDIRDLETYFEDIKITIPKKKEGQHLGIQDLQKLRKLEFDKKDYSLERAN